MLTLIALSALLLQDPPPHMPPHMPRADVRVMALGPQGHGSLDRNGDGQVSRDEFAAPMNEHFARIDRDGDGRLSTEELSAGHDVVHGEGGPHGPGHRFPGGHPDMDKDGDGKLSEAEFTAPLREAFSRMDADRSGFIEAGERGSDHDGAVFMRRHEIPDGEE